LQGFAFVLADELFFSPAFLTKSSVGGGAAMGSVVLLAQPEVDVDLSRDGLRVTSLAQVEAGGEGGAESRLQRECETRRTKSTGGMSRMKNPSD